MPAPDPFPRRTATPGRLAPWLREALRTAPALAGSYGPGRGLRPRTRERVMLAVSEVNGCRYGAWVHGAWHEFLGDDGVDTDEAVLAYARACAEAGRPLDPAPLDGVLPARSVRAVRATVARIEVSNLVGNTADGLVARLAGRRPLEPLTAAGEAAVVGLSLPLAVPWLAAAAALRGLHRFAPPVPEVRLPGPGEANLLAHLVAQAVPAYLSNALVRLLVLQLPFTVGVGLRSGRSAATVRIGRRAVEVVNGIEPDAAVVVEGDVEPLLQLATGRLARELASVRLRPNP